MPYFRFEKGPRIPNSKYIDIDDISARRDLYPELNPKGLPHMMPPKELFAALMDEYDIRNPDHIIIYGRETCIFLPRTWFLFRSLGHDPGKIHLMQGSLEEWIDAGGEIDNRFCRVPKANDLNLRRKTAYVPRDASYICEMSEILSSVMKDGVGLDKETIILDSRGSSYSKGHIPNAIHIPYSTLHCKENSLKLKSKKYLKKVFEAAGIKNLKTEQKIICSCGSGVSVCHLMLAMEQCGRNIDKNT
eukprot:CAMPEP_0184857904 /NCGR_PEP_ID=MMETSP0580-20130426/3047_1 /TAXON_ID=1118495 /ORGANISM="Dactyliosolen fragilissimus" /LENGTH=245 /DNA_ID=CAMNT_0027353767 /DNA_START=485 /DNA_END=1218 /DNA_ORIENTATION=-